MKRNLLKAYAAIVAMATCIIAADVQISNEFRYHKAKGTFSSLKRTLKLSSEKTRGITVCVVSPEGPKAAPMTQMTGIKAKTSASAATK